MPAPIKANYNITESTSNNDQKSFKYVLRNTYNIIKLELSSDKNIDILITNKGYINATNLCRCMNKFLNTFSNLEDTKVMYKSISHPRLIDKSESTGGIYFHPKIAKKLAYWISFILGEKITELLNRIDIVKDVIKEETQLTLLTDDKQIGEYALKLQDGTEIFIPIRKDGMVNLTALCKAGGKLLGDYMRNKDTIAFLHALENDMEISITKLIEINKGGNPHLQGSWGHRKVGYHMAQWISPHFAVQVTNILDELFLTGKVELGKEKTVEELENIYQKKIQDLQNELNIKQELVTNVTQENLVIRKSFVHLQKLHDKSLKKRSHYKFLTGPCLYIIANYTQDELVLDFLLLEKETKFGFCEKDFNKRLQQHRTTMPNAKVLFLVYLQTSKLLEDCVRARFNNKLVCNNHEYIIKMRPDELINAVKDIINTLKLEVTYDNNLDKYNNPYNPMNLYILENKDNENIEVMGEESDDTEETCKCKGEYCYCKTQPEIVLSNGELQDETNIVVESPQTPEYSCDLCDKIYKAEGNLTNHLIKVHKRTELEIGSTKCTICNAELSNKGKLKRHIDTVHKKLCKVKCDQCESEYSSNDALKEHVNRIHLKISSVKCDQCDLILSSKGNLTKHVEDVHNKENRIECDQCHKIFINPANLKAHVNAVHEKIYKKNCPICSKEFLSRFGYEAHMMKEHKVFDK